MHNSVVNIKKLKKTFGEVIAVDELDLEIYKGELFALVGPDGAGKTTTIRMLCGIIPPGEGEVNILGFDLKRNRSEIVNRIGYLSQRFSLYADLSIDENIEFFADIHNVKDYKARRDELLGYMRLTQFRKRYAGQLSGGMKQKLALACTLIHKPEIIFLDEPTTGVDPVSRRDFWKILSDLLKSGITIVMTTPYLDEAERCHRVGLMNSGRMMVVDSPEKIKSLMPGVVVELICDNIHYASALLKKRGYVGEIQTFGDRMILILDTYDSVYPEIERKLKEYGIKIQSSRVISPSLENVYISLMQSGVSQLAASNY